MPSKAKAAEFYIATESGSCEIKGESYVFVKGVTRIRAGHALLKACPDYFAPLEEKLHYDDAPAPAKRGETRTKAAAEPEPVVPDPEPERPADVPSGLSHAGLAASKGGDE